MFRLFLYNAAYLKFHAGAVPPAEEGNVVFGICQFMSLEMKCARRPPGSLYSVFCAICAIYQEVYLPNLNIGAF